MNPPLVVVCLGLAQQQDGAILHQEGRSRQQNFPVQPNHIICPQNLQPSMPDGPRLAPGRGLFPE